MKKVIRSTYQPSQKDSKQRSARDNKAVGFEQDIQDINRQEQKVETMVSDEEIAKKSKRSFMILATLLGFSALLIGLLIFWSVFPYQVLDIKSPVPVQNKTVKAGQILFLKVNYCKRTNAEGNILRFMVSDEIEYRLPQQTDQQKAQCLKDQLVPVLIPEGTKPDKYHIRFRAIYQVNPIKQIEEVFATQTFTVVK